MFFNFKVIILAAMLQCIVAAGRDTRLGVSKGYKLEYFFKADWYMANLFCRYHGMELASIETAEQQVYIAQLIADNVKIIYGHELHKTFHRISYGSEYFWTSGADLQNEGQWSWYSSGNKFQYTNWHPGQPDNAFNNQQREDCMHLYLSHKWNDYPCNKPCYFICEIPLR